MRGALKESEAAREVHIQGEAHKNQGGAALASCPTRVSAPRKAQP